RPGHHRAFARACASDDLHCGHARGNGRPRSLRSAERVMAALSNLAAALASGGLVGFALGLVGGGGSILATPLLLYVVGVSQPHIAIGTSALAVSVNAFANLVGHARSGNVRWRCALVFAGVGTSGALAGSSLGKMIDGERLLFLFGLLMFLVG